MAGSFLLCTAALGKAETLAVGCAGPDFGFRAGKVADRKGWYDVEREGGGPLRRVRRGLHRKLHDKQCAGFDGWSRCARTVYRHRTDRWRMDSRFADQSDAAQRPLRYGERASRAQSEIRLCDVAAQLQGSRR